MFFVLTNFILGYIKIIAKTNYCDLFSNLYSNFTFDCYVISGGASTLSEMFMRMIILPHLATLLLQLASLHIVIRDDFQDRIFIGGIFALLILVSFLSGDFAIDMVVLSSLASAVVVRGLMMQKNIYVIFGMCIVTALLALLSYFLVVSLAS